MPGDGRGLGGPALRGVSSTFVSRILRHRALGVPRRYRTEAGVLFVVGQGQGETEAGKPEAAKPALKSISTQGTISLNCNAPSLSSTDIWSSMLAVLVQEAFESGLAPCQAIFLGLAVGYEL